jgi:hypothetical protein
LEYALSEPFIILLFIHHPYEYLNWLNQDDKMPELIKDDNVSVKFDDYVIERDHSTTIHLYVKNSPKLLIFEDGKDTLLTVTHDNKYYSGIISSVKDCYGNIPLYKNDSTLSKYYI